MEIMEFLRAYAEIGWALFAVLFVLLIFFGLLVPRAQVRALVAIWEKAYQKSEEARAQQATMMEKQATAVEEMAEIVRNARRGPGGKR